MLYYKIIPSCEKNILITCIHLKNKSRIFIWFGVEIVKKMLFQFKCHLVFENKCTIKMQNKV